MGAFRERASCRVCVPGALLPRPISAGCCCRHGVACSIFLLEGEAIVTNESSLAVFDLIRRKRHGGDAVLIAFDLIELDGEDLRRSPIEHVSVTWQS